MDEQLVYQSDPWRDVVSLCNLIEHHQQIKADLVDMQCSGSYSRHDVQFLQQLDPTVSVTTPSLEEYGPVATSNVLATLSMEASDNRLSELWERLKVALIKAMRHGEIILDRAFTGIDDTHQRVKNATRHVEKLSGKPKQANVNFHSPGRLMVGGKIPSNLTREITELERIAEQIYGQYGKEVGRFYREVKVYFEDGGVIKPLTVAIPQLQSARLPYRGGGYKEEMVATPLFIGDYLIATPRDRYSKELTTMINMGKVRGTELILPTLQVDECWRILRGVSDLLARAKTFQRTEIDLRKVRVGILSSVDRFSKKEATTKEQEEFNTALRAFASNHTGVMRDMTTHILRASRALLQYCGKSMEQYTK